MSLFVPKLKWNCQHLIKTDSRLKLNRMQLNPDKVGILHITMYYHFLRNIWNGKDSNGQKINVFQTGISHMCNM